MKVISFKNDAFYDRDTNTVLFSAVIASEIIPCAISKQALDDHFPPNQRAAIDAFRKHHAAIEQIAERLISRGRFEDDGLVLIETNDF